MQSIQVLVDREGVLDLLEKVLESHGKDLEFHIK